MKTVLYEGLQEKDVGITEYISSIPGISGILKHRLINFKISLASIEVKSISFMF